MPLVRTENGNFRGKRELARGELAVTATDDTRDFRSPPRTPEPGALGRPVGLSLLDGDLLVYGWKPLVIPIMGFGMYVFIYGWIALWGFLRDEPGTWGWQALIMIPLGYWMFIKYPFKGGYPRLVIFDRRRGLVHVPRWFSGRLDAVPFADANVLLIDVAGGYMGRSPGTEMYVARPGWSLWCGEYPPWYARIAFAGFGAETDVAEQSWRHIITFMTEPLEASEWVERTAFNKAAVAELSYDNDWLAMRRAQTQGFRRLYGSKLLTEPNWVCDEEGRWQRRPDGPRERIELPDGPEAKRVPV